MNKKIILLVSLLLFDFIGCSSSELMLSSATSSKIVIDGNHEDWSGKLKYFKDERVAVGFQNDEENLYLCLVTSNKSSAVKILSLGLTIWFKPDNNEETIGLQYPKRMDKVSSKNLMKKNRNQDRNTDFEMTVNALLQNQNEFLLVDEDEEIIYASPISSNDGYKIKIGSVNQQFVYEAKVPIGNNNIAQIPINIFPNEKIIVRFQTGEIDFDEMRESGGMQQAGMGKGGGGRSGGGKGGGGRGGGQQGSGSGNTSRMGMERFKLDVEVKLSK